MNRVIVFYEDRRGEEGDFPFHDLVKSLVFAIVDNDRVEFERALADCRPLKGKEKLLRACQEWQSIAARGEAVAAVFDNDRVRELLSLPTDAADAEVITAIKSGSSSKLHVALLDRNLESVIDAVLQCWPDAPAKPKKKPDRLFRDVVLKQAAQRVELHQCILEKVPSLGLLRDLLVSLLRE